MDMQKIQLTILCCVNFLLFESAYGNTPKLITVYGLNQGINQKTSKHQDINYLLQLNAFKNNRNAVLYRDHIARQTDSPVQVVPSPKLKDYFCVIVGPFNNVKMLHQVSEQLSLNTGIKVVSRQAKHTSEKKAQLVTMDRGVKKSKLFSVTSVNSSGVWKDMKPTPVFKTGPFLGASAGLIANITANRLIYQGIEGTFSGGWSGLWQQRFYLALELYGGDSIPLKDFRDPPTNDSVRSTWSYGGSVVPGYMITDSVLLYLRGGVVQMHLVGRENPAFVQVKHEDLGWRAGLGAQTNVYNNVDLRGEYVFSLYNFQRWGKVQTSQFNIGFIYNLS